LRIVLNCSNVECKKTGIIPMLIRLLSLFIILISFTGYAQKPIKGGKPPSGKAEKIMRSKLIKKVSYFNRVKVKGLINVSLHSNYSKPAVILRGDIRDLRRVSVHINNGILNVVLGKGDPDYAPVNVEIRTKRLNEFSYEGSGVVKGTRLNSSSLSLCIDNDQSTILGGHIALQSLKVRGSGLTKISGISNRALRVHVEGNPNVQLSGRTYLQELTLKGNGFLSFHWVDSPLTIIRACDAATVQLAGITDELHVELWGNAKFKGRYLRANRVFAKTHGRSVAEISAVVKQHTLAKDASDIYYYNIADMQTNFMAYNGAVLDMREWPLYALEEYDRYNKHIP